MSSDANNTKSKHIAIVIKGGKFTNKAIESLIGKFTKSSDMLIVENQESARRLSCDGVYVPSDFNKHVSEFADFIIVFCQESEAHTMIDAFRNKIKVMVIDASV